MDQAPILAGGDGFDDDPPPEPREGWLLVRVHVPELNVFKSLQFPSDRLIWDIKQQVSASLPKSSARSQRVRPMLDLRQSKRSQVFRSHRLRHFLASDDRIRQQFQAICYHLDKITCYSDEQKLTALLLTMITQTPQFADFIPIETVELATEITQRINDEVRILISYICYIVTGIDANYLIDKNHGIAAAFENDSHTFRLNINSISDLLVELLSLLLQSFSSSCQTKKISVSNDMLCMLDLCYQRLGHNQNVVERVSNTILALTQGIGRFERTKAIVEHETLMQRLMTYQSIGSCSLIVLKIFNGITNGFAENIECLLRLNLLSHLKYHLTSDNQTSYAIVEECLHILENICGNHRSDVQAVIDAQLIPPLINVFKVANDDIDLRKIVCNIFYTITSLGSIEQIKVLLNFDLLRLLSEQLHLQSNLDEDTLETILELMNNILRDFFRREHPAYHQICDVISECDGFKIIYQLISHNNETIANVALQLNQYTGKVCAGCHPHTFTMQ